MGLASNSSKDGASEGPSNGTVNQSCVGTAGRGIEGAPVWGFLSDAASEGTL